MPEQSKDTKDCLKHGTTPRPPVSEDERDPMCTCEGTKATEDAKQRSETHRLGQVITRLRAQLQRADFYISQHVYTGYDHCHKIRSEINTLLKETLTDGE